ncbi:hypothetical protein N478_09870 [Pseudoalteromonas luteoviolacea S4060-1]|uniref:Uncharacterized protein n=1 Tax=Pseudoalteromonas luteoviolacea S4060-1 TaxID=1365257 RepID=A0A162BBP5_9GAMM|nr:hypothetical protein N478_09870 [Pseudoalteromonas luteoviolacea S4060-1]
MDTPLDTILDTWQIEYECFCTLYFSMAWLKEKQGEISQCFIINLHKSILKVQFKYGFPSNLYKAIKINALYFKRQVQIKPNVKFCNKKAIPF